MNNIANLFHQLDPETRQCLAIVETPRGSRIKFKFEPDTGLFGISKFLPKGFIFPFEFGFIPGTLAADGDPLDVIVLMDEPSHVGCLLKIRVVGVLEVVQTADGKETPDARVVGIPVQSFDYRNIKSIADFQPDLKQQIEEFLELYNKNAGKQDRIKNHGDPQRAIEIITQASHPKPT